MIYFDLQETDFLKAYMSLEELVCLQSFVGQKSRVRVSNGLSHVLDLSPFVICEYIPDEVLECDMSNKVCMFEGDLTDFDGEEFLFYNHNQQTVFFRLEKFFHQTILVKFSEINLYETKYFSSNFEAYHASKKAPFEYGLSNDFKKQYQYLVDDLPALPLIILGKKIQKYDFPFNECLVYSHDIHLMRLFLEKNNLIGHNIREYFTDRFFEASKNIEPFILSAAEKYTDLYGVPGDMLFNALCKEMYKKDYFWEPKILESPQYFKIDGFRAVNNDPKGLFDFSKKQFSCDRNTLLKYFRTKDCFSPKY